MGNFEAISINGAGMVKPCSNCGQFVEVFPGNSSLVNSRVFKDGHVRFTLQAPCPKCRNVNKYVMCVTSIKKTDGLVDELLKV